MIGQCKGTCRMHAEGINKRITKHILEAKKQKEFALPRQNWAEFVLLSYSAIAFGNFRPPALLALIQARSAQHSISALFLGNRQSSVGFGLMLLMRLILRFAQMWGGGRVNKGD